MEEKNNGFFKGFWVGFGVFLVCAVLIGGVMLMQGLRTRQPRPIRRVPAKRVRMQPQQSASKKSWTTWTHISSWTMTRSR